MAVTDVCRKFASLLLQSSGKLMVQPSLKPTSSTSHYLSRCLHTSGSLNGKMKFIKQGIDTTKYTMRPLPLPRSGGRGHNGRIQTHGVGGGNKKYFRMVDFKRVGPTEGEPLVEQVLSVRYDPCRTSDIAVVGGGNRKRFILASQNMKPGDLIKTSGKLTRMAVRAAEGDAHPVGSLPLGSVVHNVELYSGEGGVIARAAGTSAQLVRKVGDRCIVRMPSKREINISQDCMVTVGRVSNMDHNKKIIGKAGRNRWFGIRPQSGWWHRKTGYNGRKIRPIKPTKTYLTPPPPKPGLHKFAV
ncbi:large ribosomal subunit protein uL2m-like [Babylonia areolata]|uniref:large ribosomal subunit protein uL2m-like n=1 Tax=Babylonia areolata TaxID=304850 RepID=UPI003FD2A8A4